MGVKMDETIWSFSTKLKNSKVLVVAMRAAHPVHLGGGHEVRPKSNSRPKSNRVIKD